jgi:L-fuconolactonase
VPYIEILIELFGPSRLIWGSDWPVVTTAATYAEWFTLSQKCLAPLGGDALWSVMAGNAMRTYGIGSLA